MDTPLIYAPIEYAKTQRGRDMLIYGGYRYVENRQSTKNKFWRCSRYVKFGCRATVVTSKQPNEVTIRVAGTAHSHGPDAQRDDLHLNSIGIYDDDAVITKQLLQTDEHRSSNDDFEVNL